MEPIVLTLSQKDYSLFSFFVSYNLLEVSRFFAKYPSSGNTMLETGHKRLVLYGYEKTGVPPTTYSIKFSSDLLQFRFVLDEEESVTKKAEGIMNIKATNASWSLMKNADFISRQRANVDSICLTQTSNRLDWGGFPDLLLPLPTSNDSSLSPPHCLFKFSPTTYPNGNNVKTMDLNAAGIYMIIPAWKHVGSFFQNLPASPEIFEHEEMSSIIQIGKWDSWFGYNLSLICTYI